MKKMFNPQVSVIIPTYNSEKYLDKCLKSIKNQTYPKIELIIVDNKSADKTKKIAIKYTKKLFNKGPERSSQRNFGVKKSKGKYVLIIDSDMILKPKVVETCIQKVKEDEKIKQLIIPEKSIGKGFWSKIKAFERSFYVGDETIEAARFFEKKIFENFKGYDNRIKGGGEEYDLPERILAAGYMQSRINVFIKHQEGHLTLWETMKTKYYYGKTAGIYIKKQPQHAKKKIKIFRPVFFQKKQKLINHPIMTIAMFFMKTCELSSGGLGYIFSKFQGR